MLILSFRTKIGQLIAFQNQPFKESHNTFRLICNRTIKNIQVIKIYFEITKNYKFQIFNEINIL